MRTRKMNCSVRCVAALAIGTGLCFTQITMATPVSWSIAQLAIDGSNIANDGLQHVGESLGENDIVAPQGSWTTNNPDVEDYDGLVNGVDIHLNPENYSTTYSAGDYDRNRKFEPYGTSGAFHDLMESAMFSGGGTGKTVTINNLVSGHDYRVQFLFWDNEVEGEGDAKELRSGFIVSQDDIDNIFAFDSQTVLNDGDAHQDFFANIVTGEWTADETSVTFQMVPDAAKSNDNMVITGFFVHNLTIPEPTSISLLSIAGLMGLRSRRNSMLFG